MEGKYRRRVAMATPVRQSLVRKRAVAAHAHAFRGERQVAPAARALRMRAAAEFRDGLRAGSESEFADDEKFLQLRFVCIECGALCRRNFECDRGFERLGDGLGL